MKIKILLVVGVCSLLSGFTVQTLAAQSSEHRDITVWIASPTGSHLGAGYVSTYLTNIRAKTIGEEDPKLRNAINRLDGLGMLPVKGFGLVPAAVAWQTETRMRTVIVQQAETGLSYGELLIANTLAAKSKESFAQVVALRTKARTWGELAGQLHVDPDLLITRARIASLRIRAVDAKFRQKPQKDNTSWTSNNPHTQKNVRY